MKEIQSIQGRIDKIDAELGKPRQVGTGIMFFVVRNTVVGLSLYILAWVFMYTIVGMKAPNQNELFVTVMMITCIGGPVILTLSDLLSNKVRVLGIAISAYQLGRKHGAPQDLSKTKVHVPSKLETPKKHRNIELKENVKAVLQSYYNTGKPLTRNTVMDMIVSGNNKRQSSEEVLRVLFDAGILVKGANRNDPNVVIPKSYSEAVTKLKEMAGK